MCSRHAPKSCNPLFLEYSVFGALSFWSTLLWREVSGRSARLAGGAARELPAGAAPGRGGRGAQTAPGGGWVDPNPLRVPGQGSGEPSLDASALYVHCSTILEGLSGDFSPELCFWLDC